MKIKAQQAGELARKWTQDKQGSNFLSMKWLIPQALNTRMIGLSKEIEKPLC